MKKWYDEKHDLTIVYMNLPKNVDEAITANSDGSYTAVISDRICEKRQLEAYKHALKHIENNDLEDGKVVQELEKKCREAAEPAVQKENIA